MINISKRVKLLQASQTLTISALAAKLKSQGKEIISLSAGEPDMNTPNSIKIFAKHAIDDNKTRYTPASGIIELRQEIVKKYNNYDGLDFKDSNISITVGAKQGLFAVLFSSVNPGDEVLIPIPYWVSYPALVQLCGGNSVFIKGNKDNFKINPETLAQSITKKTRWLILNSPSNPSGAVYSKEELKALGDLLAQDEFHHVNVLTDDIYESIVFGKEEKASNFLSVNPHMKDRTVLVNGFSKAYNMTGWRLGFVASFNSELIKQVNKINSQTTSSTSSISQWAGVKALNGDQSFIKEDVAKFKKRRDYIVTQLNTIDGLKCSIPDGAFYLFLSCTNFIGKKTPTGKIITTDEDFVLYLLNEGVATVHGTAFGMPGYFRISYATSMKNLKRAIEFLTNALAQLI